MKAAVEVRATAAVCFSLNFNIAITSSLSVYRIHQRLAVRKVLQDDIRIGLCNRERWYGLVFKVEDIAVAFLAQSRHTIDIDYIFPVASDQSAVLETLLDCLQTATEHILLKFPLTVCVPDFYLVVIGLYII